MDPGDHSKTASNDFGQDAAKKASAKAFRDKQAALMAAGDIAGALQMDVVDIQGLQQAGKLRYNYDAAIAQAKDTLTNGKLDDCNRRYPKGGSLAQAGTTTAPPTAPPGAVAPVSATGQGLTPGQSYNAVLSDAGQLAQNPNWQASGRALNPYPIIADSAGNIPSQNLTVGGTFYWEPHGEEGSAPASAGQAKIGFVAIGVANATNPATVTVTAC